MFPRYLKRGVNEKGRVANDVDIEHIVFEDDQDGNPVRISSVVQNRGSIPLFWSQEASRLNIKPDIILSAKDPGFEATILHFENLAKRYGNPIIILNLIKVGFLTCGMSRGYISKEERLRPLHWDLHKHSRRKGTNVLAIFDRLTTYALNLTGIFYCQLSLDLSADGFQNQNQNASTLDRNTKTTYYILSRLGLMIAITKSKLEKQMEDFYNVFYVRLPDFYNIFYVRLL